MLRALFALLAAAMLVSACATTPADPNGRTIFWIKERDAAEIQRRHVEAVNAVRQAQGLSPLEWSPALAAAARRHAEDIARQNRPWHFGSDGSSPLDRVAASGFEGRFLAENLSETFENDMETLEAWMRDPVTRAGMMLPEARYIGLGWYQEPTGKIWWVQDIGG